MMHCSPFRYPFGEHGYHRPQGKSGKVELKDPINVFGSTYDPTYKDRMAAADEEVRKEHLRARINAMYGHGDESAAAALDQEKTKLAEATRAYYTDELGDQASNAERKTRFKLARQGLLGGSEEVSQQGDVVQDRDLGATRVDEAVRRAVMGLSESREQERLNALNLANSGAGEGAVSAASAGLRNSIESAQTAQKAELFGDLFAGAADAGTANNLAAQEALLASRYRDRLGAFFNNSGRSTSSGRVTPSS
jgi:hypothetical protein